jgi:glycosyltransferase involved in cell wall biosynthesis
LKSLARKLRVHNRAEGVGEVNEPEKRELYARARAVVYPPIDEDYGYVTLEAMLASKPLIVCDDSGGPLEFVRHEETGLIAEPQATSLAKAFDRVWRDGTTAKRWGEAGRALYKEMDITWPHVVRKLLA